MKLDWQRDKKKIHIDWFRIEWDRKVSIGKDRREFIWKKR